MGDGRWEMGRWGSRRKKETNEKQGENSSREIARLHSQALTFLFDKLVQKAGLSHTHVTCIHKQKQMKPNSTFIRARLCEHVCVCVCVCVPSLPSSWFARSAVLHAWPNRSNALLRTLAHPHAPMMMYLKMYE